MYDYAKREFEKHYDSLLTIYELRPIPNNPFEKDEWVEVATDIACRIKQKQLNATSKDDIASFDYTNVLYCSPEFEIKAGSKLVVTDIHNHIKTYKRTSDPFNSYRTHQEIIVVRSEKA